MKKIILFIVPLALAGMMACNQAPPAASSETGTKNKAVVDGYIQAVTKGDVASIGNFLADNFKGYGPYLRDSTDKAKTIASWKTNWDSVFTAINYTRYEAQAINIADGQNKGDWVLEWGLVKADYKNGSPSVSIAFHEAYRLENEKIVFSVAYYNVADILEQQGFKFVPPDKPTATK